MVASTCTPKMSTFAAAFGAESVGAGVGRGERNPTPKQEAALKWWPDQALTLPDPLLGAIADWPLGLPRHAVLARDSFHIKHPLIVEGRSIIGSPNELAAAAPRRKSGAVGLWTRVRLPRSEA